MVLKCTYFTKYLFYIHNIIYVIFIYFSADDFSSSDLFTQIIYFNAYQRIYSNLHLYSSNILPFFRMSYNPLLDILIDQKGMT